MPAILLAVVIGALGINLRHVDANRRDGAEADISPIWPLVPVDPMARQRSPVDLLYPVNPQKNDDGTVVEDEVTTSDNATDADASADSGGSGVPDGGGGGVTNSNVAQNDCIYSYPNCEPFCLTATGMGNPGRLFPGTFLGFYKQTSTCEEMQADNVAETETDVGGKLTIEECERFLALEAGDTNYKGATYMLNEGTPAEACYQTRRYDLEPLVLSSPHLYEGDVELVDCPASTCEFMPGVPSPSVVVQGGDANALNAIHDANASGWRPFSKRYAAGSRCYAGEWAIRRSTDPDWVEERCVAMEEDACTTASDCEWRVDAPEWYDKLTGNQEKDTLPYQMGNQLPHQIGWASGQPEYPGRRRISQSDLTRGKWSEESTLVGGWRADGRYGLDIWSGGQDRGAIDVVA